MLRINIIRKIESGLLEVSWYLSKYGKKAPPILLDVDSLKEAILLFYSKFGAGKTEVAFYNSMRNYRDRFDSWLSDVRKGWRNADGSSGDLSLPAIDVMNKMNGLPISLVDQKILYWLSPNPSKQEVTDFSYLVDDETLNEKMKERLIAARLGQGEFRKNRLKLSPVSPVIGIFFYPLLRASHIKA